MIDSHCHLNFHSFEKDYDQVIKNASSAGIKAIINAGTQINSSKKAVELAEKYENLFAVVAIHPHHADKLETTWLTDLEEVAKHPKVVGIGECGLDYYNYQSNGVVDPVLQRRIFIQHIELAHKLHLPLQIHSRGDKARFEVIDILQNHKHLLQNPPGMFHCFAGSLESLKSVLQMGFYVGFDGNITYETLPPGEPMLLSELVKYMPLDRIVVETDSPYLTPVPHRGQRNEPKYAIITGKYIAKIKGVPFEEIVEETERNVYTIFTRIKSNS